jgi:hypothetical protein
MYVLFIKQMAIDWVTTSDASAALIGAGWSSIYNVSTPGMLGGKAFIISVVARLLSTTELASKMSSLDDHQKNQLFVAIANALDTYRTKGNGFKGALQGVAIDLIGQEVLRTFNMEDKALISSQ